MGQASMNDGLFRLCSHRLAHYGILLAVGSALFLLNLGGASLWDLDEGRNSTCSREMWESGDWVRPTFNSELRPDKPALLYWLQATCYELFGLNEFSARLPSALAALMTLLVCYELARRLFGSTTGLWSGLVLASTPMFCAAARFANPDALLNCFTALTLFIFWLGYRRPGWFWFGGTGISTGLAVLAKGPVGLLLPAAVIGLFLLWNRRLHLLFSRRLVLGVLTFCLVALPWYVWVGVETKAHFLRDFLLGHNLDRYLNPMESHRGPIYYYLVVLVVGFAPWSAFLALSLWYAGWSMVRRPWSWARTMWSRFADRPEGTAAESPATNQGLPTANADAYRFLFVWIVVYLLFFSVAATKLPNYVLPLYLPTAVLLGRLLDRWGRGAIQPGRLWVALTLACLALAGVGACFGLLLAGGKVPMAFMRGRYVDGIQHWTGIGLVLVAGAIWAGWWLKRNRPHTALAGATLAVILFITPMAVWAAASMNRHKAPKALVELAGACRRDQDVRIGCWQLDHLPSFNFYCQRDVKYFKDEKDILAFLCYPTPVFLFLPEDVWQALARRVQAPYRLLGRHHDFYHACHVVVVTNCSNQHP
jgi:4-amino-4-deoxy-L-arabinose transferase-like glycosyltransferase